MTTAEFKIHVLPVKDKIFRLAKRILNDIEDAEDVIQEVFYKLWERKEEISGYRSIEAFAMTVTKNLCLDRIKAKGYRNEPIGEWNTPADHRSPEKIVELKDEIGMVHALISRLPEQSRIIIQLRDIEGMEFDEIAEIMQMKPNAVRVALSRARKSIKEQVIKNQMYEYQGN